MNLAKMSFTKKRLLITGAIVLLVLIYIQYSYSSLDRFLNRRYSDVKIHCVNDDDKLVMFSTGEQNDTIYVVAKTRNFMGYYFDLYDEEGWSYTNKPYLLVHSYKFKVGNIVWGVTEDSIDVSRLMLTYTDGKDEYSQEVKVADNAFMAKLPPELVKTNFINDKWSYSIKAYNQNDESVIEEVDNRFQYVRSSYSRYY